MAKANLGIAEVAQSMGLDKQTVRVLIQQGVVSWGKVYRLPGSKRRNYLISPKLFFEETGIALGGLKDE